MHRSVSRLYLVLLVLLTGSAFFFLNSEKPVATRELPVTHSFHSAADVSVFLEELQSAPPADRPKRIREATEIAVGHRDSFLKLMEKSPARALAEALPIADYAALPESLKPYFARPISGVGSIDLLWEKHTDAGCRPRHVAYLGDESWRVSSEEFQRARRPQRDVPISGIVLGGQVVLSPSGVRSLDLAEASAAASLFPSGNADGIDPVTGIATSGEHAALIGGRIYQFESEQNIDAVARTLTVAEKTRDGYAVEHGFEWLAASGGGGEGGEPPVAANPYQENELDVLFVRIDFSDFPGEPVTQAALQTTLNSVRDEIEDFSYNEATLIHTVTPGVYRMPRTAESYALAGDNNGIRDDARALAAADFTLADYDVVAFFFTRISNSTIPGSKINYGGLASIGGANHWINGSNSTNTILHEFGHNFGLYHSNYYDPSESLSGDYDIPGSREYGDIFDVMGAGNAPEGHFNHFAKHRLEWMPDSKVVEPTGTNTYRIYRFDHPNALANPLLAVRVPMGGDLYYWVGYRQLYTSTSYNLDEGAYIVSEGFSQGAESNLIDTTPGSATPESSDRRDSGLEIGAPYSESGVTFEALARGGTEPNQWIDVQITFAGRIGFTTAELEVDEGSGMAYLTLQRQFSSAGTASVDYATTAGSATAGSDYYDVSGTVTWSAGDTADKTIGIPIRPDNTAEGREDFTVTLSGAGGASLDAAATTATVTILDPGERFESFGPAFFNNLVDISVPLPDGKLLIGGLISHTSGDFGSISDLARLNPDGGVDTTFLSGTGFNDRVRAIVVQDDGKILIGGDFTSYNGSACNRFVRLNENGTVDSTFLTNIGTAANDAVFEIAIESSGSILIGGSLDSFNGVIGDGIVRINADGTSAAAMTTPFAQFFGTRIYAIRPLPGGGMVVGGSFYIQAPGSGFRSSIARLNSDGTRDATFEPGGGTHVSGNTSSLRSVEDVEILPDGDYLICGQFTAYDGNDAPRIARLESDGTFDSSFNPPAFDDTVYEVTQQAGGKIIVGSRASSAALRLVRLNSNGATDTSFDVGAGPTSGSGSVYSIVADDAGTVFVGGNFFAYDGTSTRPIIRVAAGADPFEGWRENNFTTAQIISGIAASTADPDSDGIDNATEWAVGTSPLSFDENPASAEIVTGTGASDYLQLTVPRGSSGAWLVAQFTDDLITWSPDPASPASNAIYDLISTGGDQFIIRDKAPISARRFVRFGGTVPE